MIYELLENLTKAGITLKLSNGDLSVNAPKNALTSELREQLVANKPEIVEHLVKAQSAGPSSLPNFIADDANRFEPFPLTDLQHAYWLGRDPSMGLGGVATHLYVELKCHAIDLVKLQRALNTMVEENDMLRTMVDSSGQQRVLESVEQYKISVAGSESDASIAEAASLAVRDTLSHEVRNPSIWPLWEVRATQFPEGIVHLHVSLDLLALDALSIFLFFEKWKAIYSDNPKNNPETTIRFRDYCLYESELASVGFFKNAEKYWQARLDSLPPPPDLPIKSDAINPRDRQVFQRYEFKFPSDKWQGLIAKIRQHGLTASSFLVSVYGEILARYSSSAHFTINTTVSNRLPIDPTIDNVIGDFIDLILLEIDRTKLDQTFLEFAKHTHGQLSKDLEHTGYSGVKLMRDWSKLHGLVGAEVMPVVFSSGLVLGDGVEVGNLEQFGKKIFSISQTPQVWIDQHVVEVNQELVLVWDVPTELFDSELIKAMFDDYCALIEDLFENDSKWNSALSTRDSVPLHANSLLKVPRYNLHRKFVENAIITPDRIALHNAGLQLSYGQLLNGSIELAERISAVTPQVNAPVAIVMNKSWEQVVAVMAILLCGKSYVPIDANLPEARIQALIEQVEPSVVICQSELVRVNSVPSLLIESHPKQSTFDIERLNAFSDSINTSVDSLAYMIFTSGTTGMPKGVMMNHHAVMNTIESVNDMIGLNKDDSLLMISSLSFDLSVYDIFGALSVGASLVIPEAKLDREPDHWFDLMQQHNITTWNSAPQLMRMMADHIDRGDTRLPKLEKVLLSGDWIPIDLPTRVRAFGSEGLRFWSLGGATEAAIWSIFHEVKSVELSLSSIPYGKALPNQSVFVLDHSDRCSPKGVTGRIHIGGVGLAEGYWKDQSKSDQKFADNPWSEQRLYETGDLGRYLADGSIEILGRDDRQIKLRGYRIELGEVESTIRQHLAIVDCAVIFHGHEKGKSSGSLTCFTVCENENTGGVDGETLSRFIGEILPSYMVPEHFEELEALPLSRNGKVDFASLTAFAESIDRGPESLVAPRNKNEEQLLSAWLAVLPEANIGVTDSFFDLGGDSVLATQLLAEIRERCNYPFEMHDLFETLTIEGLAEKIAEESVDSARVESSAELMYPGNQLENPVVSETRYLSQIEWPAEPNDDVKKVRQDVGDLFTQLSKLNFKHSEVANSTIENVFVTGAEGWVGVHTLFELLSNTDATVHCLTRNLAQQTGTARNQAYTEHLENLMIESGLCWNNAWCSRVNAIPGDLAKAQLGIDDSCWEMLCNTADAIIHLAADLNAICRYQNIRTINVLSITDITLLAQSGRPKKVVVASPLNHCRRIIDNQINIHSARSLQFSTEGIATGYAMTQWAAELLWAELAKQGLDVKVLRTTRALPSTISFQSKTGDTFAALLAVSKVINTAPEWNYSSVNGVPVDFYATHLVDCASGNTKIDFGNDCIANIEAASTLDYGNVIKHILNGSAPLGQRCSVVSLDEWISLCREALPSLDNNESILVDTCTKRVNRPAAVEVMFSPAVFEGVEMPNSGSESIEYWGHVGGKSNFNRSNQIYVGEKSNEPEISLIS